MTIEYHEQTSQDYADLRYEIVRNTEGMWHVVYPDSEGIPTTGVGFNLRESSVLDRVLELFGFIPADPTDAAFRRTIEDYLAGPYTEGFPQDRRH